MDSGARTRNNRDLKPMDPKTYHTLSEIKNIYPDQYGKIFQKLLGQAFQKLDFTIDEKSIQGVDLHISRPNNEKYALEVKTTEKEEITLGKKDIEGIRKRESDGYRPGFAALRLGLLAQWVIASAQNISSGKVPIPLLESQSFGDLQKEVRGKFSEVSVQVGNKLITERPARPQIWLDKQISGGS